MSAAEPDGILVLDEGTTSTRALLLRRGALEEIAAVAQAPLATAYPEDGWVEQDAEEIWQRTRDVAREVVRAAGGPGAIAGVGITNQRETTVAWDARDGRAMAPAIVWQDRRTEDRCQILHEAGHAADVRARTGLELDPYFSGTKARWILDASERARDLSGAGHLRIGTIDAWLLWRATGGRSFATDVTNASRTMLRDLEASGDGWSPELCALLGVPEGALPRVRPSAADFGETEADFVGAPLPVLSMVGDQQSALVGHGCLSAGRAMIPSGTGAFLVAHTGETVPRSTHRLLSTVAYGIDGAPRQFALEGSIFNAGTVVQWMRDDLGILPSAEESARMASSVPDTGGVVFVPAFTGLGAPHWRSDARGALFGITRATRPEHIVRAGLEALCFQTDELLGAMARDGAPVHELRVDGGMARNDWLMQRLADLTGTPVVRPHFTERTALGAAVLAAIRLGWITAEEWAAHGPQADRFEPALDAGTREVERKRWADAVARV
ncbi:MAG: glycerol kinase GlpK [Planctomycetota bacterium]